jgi:PAS domain S-box-containing protein
MKRVQKHSLKGTVLFITALSFVILQILFFSIFFPAMLSMIHQMERTAMGNMRVTMEQSLTEKLTYLHQITITYADWTETVAFVEGRNGDFIRNNWPDKSITGEYGFNLSVFADVDNNIVYSEFYDPISNKAEIPAGLAALVAELRSKMTARQNRNYGPSFVGGPGGNRSADFQEAFKAGGAVSVTDRVRGYSGMVQRELRVLEGEPYAVCAAPVADYRSGLAPSGIFINAIKLTGPSLMAMTYHQAREIRVHLGKETAAMVPYKINLVNSKLISINIPLKDTAGNTLMLEAFQDRHDIRSGSRVIILTSIFLFLASLGIFFLLDWLFNSRVVRPISRLSADVSANKGNNALNLEGRAYYGEILSLGENINRMLQHLTDREEAEAQLLRRFEQQELTLELTRLFASPRNTDEIINSAIAAVGNFLDVCRVTFARIDRGGMLLEYPYVWQQDCVPKTRFDPVPLDPGMKLMAAFEKKELPYVKVDDVSTQPDYMIRPDPALRSFLSVPIYAPLPDEEPLWGILTLDLCDYGDCPLTRQWTESDIQLIGLIRNELSVAIARHLVQQDLDRMSAVVENAPNPVMFVDFEGKAEYVNLAFIHDFGYSLKEVSSQDLGLVLGQEEFNLFRNEALPAVIKNGRHNFILHPKRKDGVQVVHQVLAFMVILESGEQGIGIISSDITEITAAKELAEHAREEAELYNKAKSGFISRMSHEMRTPMNGIVGMAELAGNTEDRTERLEYLSKINGAARELTGIINNMLDVVKFENGSFELTPGEFDLPRMLEDLAAAAQSGSEAKGLQFHGQWEGIPRRIISDKDRLIQVLSNLLSNAIKFTSAGSVSLKASVEPYSAGSEASPENAEQPSGAVSGKIRRLCFEVSDTGPGIPETLKERLWDAFEQGDNTITRSYGGVGLGLTVSKGIVEKMGGTIDARSESGRGSVFRCLIPVQVVPEAAQPSAAQSSAVQPSAVQPEAVPAAGSDAGPGAFTGRRFLIVDDNDMNREILLAILEETGAELDSAACGEEALQKWQRSGGGYDLFFMDLHMPGMDGFEASRRIRASALPRADTVPIIAVSADTGGEVVSRCLGAGMNGHVGKPVDFEILTAAAARCLHR